MAKSLSGKVALVTGASSGIGEAAAYALAMAGAQVAITARRADRLEALASRIEASGGRALVLPADVADEAQAKQAVAATVDRFCSLDILVNSAGVLQGGGVENADAEQWRRVMDINLFATLYTCRAAIGPMRDRGRGDIINISSIAGRRPASKFASYSASKFAMNAMSEGLRQEVGGYGIRVCVIEPGATESGVAEGVSDPVYREAMRKHVTRPGVMKADDVAEAILFVASLPLRANVSELLIRPTMDTQGT